MEKVLKKNVCEHWPNVLMMHQKAVICHTLGVQVEIVLKYPRLYYKGEELPLT